MATPGGTPVFRAGCSVAMLAGMVLPFSSSQHAHARIELVHELALTGADTPRRDRLIETWRGGHDYPDSDLVPDLTHYVLSRDG